MIAEPDCSDRDHGALRGQPLYNEGTNLHWEYSDISIQKPAFWNLNYENTIYKKSYWISVVFFVGVGLQL